MKDPETPEELREYIIEQIKTHIPEELHHAEDIAKPILSIVKTKSQIEAFMNGMKGKA
jgi:hypothetical protein